MLNIRILIVAIVLAAILILAVPLAAARTEVASNPSRGPQSALEIQEAYADQNKSPVTSYRSRLDTCFDVPVAEAAACRAASQVLIPTYRSRSDQCFDVALSELASCREASQASAP